jgi:hypothetical protein
MRVPLSFDPTPLGWLVLGGLGWLAVLGMAALGKRETVLTRLWPVLVLGLLVWFRLPILLFNRELNPDESQVIAHALTLNLDPVFWRSVDGTTIGPLDLYVLLVPPAFGLPFDYTMARLVGLACLGGTWLFLFFALKNGLGAAGARLASLPLAGVLLFTQHPDLVHYSSEHVPLLLLAGALWVWSGTPPNAGPGRYFLVGLLLGMVPFAKLQGVPLAGVVGLMAAWPLLRSRAWVPLAALVGGGLTCTVLVFAWAASRGLVLDVIDFYIRGNLVYQSDATFGESWAVFFRTLGTLPELVFFLLASLGLVATGFGLGRSGDSRLGWTGGLMLAATLYAILKTGNPFGHYLLWLLVPVTLLNGWAARRLAQPEELLQRRTWFTAFFVGLFLVLLLGYRFRSEGVLNRYPSTPTANREVPQSALSREILQYARGTDRLVVWGWACRYHVETGLAQGTAENHSERCLYDHPMRDEYRRRYLADMLLNQPTVFVDAVGPASLWLQDVATQGHEAFPELAALVGRDYVYAGTVDACRLYIRRDRFERLTDEQLRRALDRPQ